MSHDRDVHYCTVCGTESWDNGGKCSNGCKEDTYVAQEGGDHYFAEYQHWDWVQETRIGYLVGNATKYLSRWRKKNGVQDLLKARTYLEKIISTRNLPSADWHYRPASYLTKVNTERFIEVNNIPEAESDIIWLLTGHCPVEMVRLAIEKLDALLATAQKAIQGQATPRPMVAPAKGQTPPHAVPCGGAGRIAGQATQGNATTGSQNSGLIGMEHPFGYDEEEDQ